MTIVAAAAAAIDDSVLTVRWEKHHTTLPLPVASPPPGSARVCHLT